MAPKALNNVLQDMRRSMLGKDGAGLLDGHLLERFVNQHDEAAFEALLRRHGPMVFAVCRRILRNEADVQDAFQATFLVLVRKAASIRARETVGNWLYGVAHKAALKVKTMNERRRAKEREAGTRRGLRPSAEEGKQLLDLVHQELQALANKYRAPIVLCDLEGMSIKEAARQLGCPPGTIGTRLARGRVLLARRLARQGLTLSGGLIAALLSEHAASASVPLPLAAFTIKAANVFAAGKAAAAGFISLKVAAVTEGVLKTMQATKLKIATALLLSVAMMAGLGVATATIQETPKPAAQEAEKRQTRHADKSEFAVTWKERAVLRSHEHEVVSVAFIGKALLTGGLDDMIRVWDPATGKRFEPEDPIVWKTYPIDFIAALPDGDKFAVSCTTPGGECINSLGTVSKGVGAGFGIEKMRGLAIASDGKTWALVAEGQKKPRLEPFPPIQDGLPPFEGEHDGNIRAAAFSPDNATLATASEDKTVKLWDCRTAKERATCKGPRQPVVCVAFAPDGKTVAAGSTDGTVWLWDATTAKEVATFAVTRGP